MPREARIQERKAEVEVRERRTEEPERRLGEEHIPLPLPPWPSSTDISTRMDALEQEVRCLGRKLDELLQRLGLNQSQKPLEGASAA